MNVCMCLCAGMCRGSLKGEVTSPFFFHHRKSGKTLILTFFLLLIILGHVFTKNTMLHCMDGPGLVMSAAWFPPNLKPGIHTKAFHLCPIRPENWKSSRQAAMCLYQGMASLLSLKATLVNCRRDGCLSGRLSFLHRGALTEWLRGSQSPPRSLTLDGWPVTETTVLTGTFKSSRNTSAPFPRFVNPHNPVSGAYRQLLWPHY